MFLSFSSFRSPNDQTNDQRLIHILPKIGFTLFKITNNIVELIFIHKNALFIHLLALIQKFPRFHLLNKKLLN
ncbi:hypothetical protein BpHYR1_010800 [Brachionus plicatilis]|uniref:Uncharacterized protein n=1 Tax=Brachionus plicatilis TaxID=10195 RepID=A0A3M7QVE2_BRAPC|nr:hypothetical protein BpHYR1_010800 [Brachionus plicatilis]